MVAAIEGRGVPLVWASYPEWELHKSQNNLEEGLLRLFRDQKNRRNGFALRNTKVQKAERFDRWLLVLA